MMRRVVLSVLALLLPSCAGLFGGGTSAQPAVNSITTMGAIQTAQVAEYRRVLEASALTPEAKLAALRELERDEADYRRAQVEVLKHLAETGGVDWEQMVMKGFEIYDARKAKR